jgi:hypothetical protein
MKYRIEQDPDPISPREQADNNLFLVAKHDQFYVSAPGETRVPQYANEVVDKYKKTHWIFPIEAYIHSGVALAFSGEGNFPDRQWDVSQLGFIFASKKEWRLSKSAREAAKGLIDHWNQYLSGDVWGYILENNEGEVIESVWGFYGHEYCEEQAKASMKPYQACVPVNA